MRKESEKENKMRKRNKMVRSGMNSANALCSRQLLCLLDKKSELFGILHIINPHIFHK